MHGAKNKSRRVFELTLIVFCHLNFSKLLELQPSVQLARGKENN